MSDKRFLLDGWDWRGEAIGVRFSYSRYDSKIQGFFSVGDNCSWFIQMDHNRLSSRNLVIHLVKIFLASEFHPPNLTELSMVGEWDRKMVNFNSNLLKFTILMSLFIQLIICVYELIFCGVNSISIS